MRAPSPATRRFTRAEYDRLIEQGFFDEDEPIELLDGLLVVKEPQGSRRVRMVSHIRRVLQRAFGERYDVLVHRRSRWTTPRSPSPISRWCGGARKTT